MPKSQRIGESVEINTCKKQAWLPPSEKREGWLMLKKKKRGICVYTYICISHAGVQVVECQRGKEEEKEGDWGHSWFTIEEDELKVFK